MNTGNQMERNHYLEWMGSSDEVECNKDMNAIDGTWAFKCKWYPNGIVKMFKARFCACGDKQLKGIGFVETFAPFEQWTTVWLMLIIENILGLLLGKMRKSMWRCFFVTSSAVQTETSRFSIPRQLFMACITIIMPFENITLKILATVAYLLPQALFDRCHLLRQWSNLLGKKLKGHCWSGCPVACQMRLHFAILTTTVWLKCSCFLLGTHA